MNQSQSEDFVRYFSKYEGNVRAFVASQLHDWEGVDEVVQSASLVMWRKFDQFDTSGEESSFLNWAFMIARFEVMKYRTSRGRDRHVFSEEVQELLAGEAIEVAGVQSERERALDICLRQLPAAQRELVDAVYGKGIAIRQVAEDNGKSATALYKVLARIRDGLQQCIERKLSHPTDLGTT